jgi:hypothetical protein
MAWLWNSSHDDPPYLKKFYSLTHGFYPSITHPSCEKGFTSPFQPKEPVAFLIPPTISSSTMEFISLISLGIPCKIFLLPLRMTGDFL